MGIEDVLPKECRAPKGKYRLMQFNLSCGTWCKVNDFEDIRIAIKNMEEKPENVKPVVDAEYAFYVFDENCEIKYNSCMSKMK